MTAISKLEAHGIPASALSGKTLETTLVVYDVDHLRSLLDLGLDEQGRQGHYEALFNGVTSIAPSDKAAPAAADDGGASIADRIAAHVIGNGTLSAADRAEVAPVFPMTIHVAAASGPLAVTSRYDLSTPDGSPRIVSFTDVTLEQGGYFWCASTPLLFTCNTLTRKGDTGTTAADFNIVGNAGVKPSTPQTPIAPSQASAGSTGECSSAGIAGPGGGPGNPGGPGTKGGDGTGGNNGTPSMQATITIQQTLTGNLTVYTQSGPGGPGGDGGQGGPGGQGGNGGNGVTCGCTGNSGGQGGDGGRGGLGGRAGDGGNGVNAAGNIVIRVPGPDDVPKVTSVTTLAPPGDPGAPGQGGPGGAGGSGSSGGKYNGGGSGGGTGGPGAPGGQGSAGSIYGNPAQVTVMPV